MGDGGAKICRLFRKNHFGFIGVKAYRANRLNVFSKLTHQITAGRPNWHVQIHRTGRQFFESKGHVGVVTFWIGDRDGVMNAWACVFLCVCRIGYHGNQCESQGVNRP